MEAISRSQNQIINDLLVEKGFLQESVGLSYLEHVDILGELLSY